MISKLMLGTAALGGVKYGDSDRITTKADMKKMVETCLEWGIYSFDTAPSYGLAEEWLGECAPKNCQIFTKNQGSKDEAFRSMERLGKPIFLWHNWKRGDKAPEWVSGVTVYAEEIDASRELLKPDIFRQVPWNILAQTDLPPLGTVIVRSVFLRGRLASDICDHPDINRLARHFGVTVQVLALRAALENDAIDRVLIGPQTDDELRRCIQIANMPPLGVGRYLGLIDLGHCKETDPREFDK